MGTDLKQKTNTIPAEVSTHYRDVYGYYRDYAIRQGFGQNEAEFLAKKNAIEDMGSDIRHGVELERIPYESLRTQFVALAEKRSIHSGRAYRRAIADLEAFAARRGIPVLTMKARDADAYIHLIEGTPSTVRLRVAVASAFFTFLERETDARIFNPFRGTKARPAKEAKMPIVPTLDELRAIRMHLTPIYSAAVVCMIEHGFRVGALPTLTLWGGRFSGRSKGKPINGNLSPDALQAMQAANLGREPFAAVSADAIRNAFRYASGRLYKAGTIAAAYSVHDIRHYFAIREYRKDRDIYRLKEALNHGSIAITETYLRGLKPYLEREAV